MHGVKKVSKMLYLWSAMAVVVLSYVISFIIINGINHLAESELALSIGPDIVEVVPA